MPSMGEARSQLADLVNRAAYRGERVPLERRGKAVAYLVPPQDVELLERLEVDEDVQAARVALETYERNGEAITLDEVAGELGIDLRALRRELHGQDDAGGRQTA